MRGTVRPSVASSAACSALRAGPSPLALAIAELKANAKAAGLTDADIDAEQAVYNAECRDVSAAERLIVFDASALEKGAQGRWRIGGLLSALAVKGGSCH
jgi:hypothetical protein